MKQIKEKVIAYLLVGSLFAISVGVIYLGAFFSINSITRGLGDLQVSLHGKSVIGYVENVSSCHKGSCRANVSFTYAGTPRTASVTTGPVEKGNQARIVFDETRPGDVLQDTTKARYVYPGFSVFLGLILIIAFLYSIVQAIRVVRGKKNPEEFALESPFVAVVVMVPFVIMKKIQGFFSK